MSFHNKSVNLQLVKIKVISMADRHAFRANWHDYNGGIYFITICSHNKIHTFGNVKEGLFYPTELGNLIDEHIRLISNHNYEVELLNYVVMPNHIHLVLSVGTRIFASTSTEPTASESGDKLGCLRPPMHGEAPPDFHHNSKLATIIGSFKAGVTRIARARKIAPLPCWQSRFHEHIIRNQTAFDNIMAYIDNNVINWDIDCFRN